MASYHGIACTMPHRQALTHKFKFRSCDFEGTSIFAATAVIFLRQDGGCVKMQVEIARDFLMRVTGIGAWLKGEPQVA